MSLRTRRGLPGGGKRRSKRRDERVICHVRLRPALGKEEEEEMASSGGCLREWNVDDGSCVWQPSAGDGGKPFVFDAFLPPKVEQEAVFQRSAASNVADVLAGYNSTVLCYGQTGTGKTHTMMGGDLGSGQEGIVPRALQALFAEVDSAGSGSEFHITASYVQLYCELLQDLLAEEGAAGGGTLSIREDSTRGVYVEGLTRTTISSPEEGMALVAAGNAVRRVAETKMNATSSRSHACLMLTVERRLLVEDGSGRTGKLLRGTLFLVDLAGSERVKKTGASGTQLAELRSINLSLSCLGNCIAALSERKKHIPYRDSKLTRLLQQSLGGNARTTLVVTIGPSSAHATETRSSLQFGQRAMTVSTSARRNEEVDYKALYESVQSALDAKDDRINELQLALAAESERADDAALAAEAARDALRRMQMELKSVAASYDAVRTVSGAVEGGDAGAASADAAAASAGESALPEGVMAALAAVNDKWAASLAEATAAHEASVVALRRSAEERVTVAKEKAAEAAREWDALDSQLQQEQTAHLETLRKLKATAATNTQLEKELQLRVGELMEELEGQNEELEQLMDALKERTALLKQKDASIAGLTEQLSGCKLEIAERERVEELLVGKVEALIGRVEDLERAGARGAAASRRSDGGASRSRRR
eukprot:PLAT16150.1.p2 GENE.PLAT16150.1~~PLAT16150.1.p2  ORF type:complete len:657 (+),score=394.15 PLAT16150.1:1770-3740(+)